jgi:hypothetical protein
MGTGMVQLLMTMERYLDMPMTPILPVIWAKRYWHRIYEMDI